jgi:hypothetical protein
MNTNNITLSFKIIGFSLVTFLCFGISLQSGDNKKDNKKKRNLISVGSQPAINILNTISNETKNLFYLVDKAGNPISLNNINQAIGSKSIQIPLLSKFTQEQQNILSNTTVSIEENMQVWIENYLSIVKFTRSKSLKKQALDAFNNAYWNKVAPRYQNGLVQILRSMSISPEIAMMLDFKNKNGIITLLFFDDPYPAHTVPGSSKKAFKDLLGEFIARYGF